jgi:SAM-dependent methyltransferase
MALAPQLDVDAFFGRDLPALRAAWGDDGEDPYQFDNPRSRNVLERLSVVAGCRVLDVGCNTGMYSFAVAPLATSVYGIDMNEVSIGRANEGKRALEERGDDLSHVEFEWQVLSKLDPTRAFDAVLACNVLYHLSDVEIGVLAGVLRGARIAMLQVRPRRVRAYEKNKEQFVYVSRNNVCGGLYTVGHALEFLQALGFSRFEISGEERYWGDEPFPVVLGWREAAALS